MTQFDWHALMQAGIQKAGLRPGEFWALTPAELRLILGYGGPATALSRKGLNELMKLHPDNRKGSKA